MTETTVHVGQTEAPKQGALSWLQFNINYFRTIPGIIKLVQVVRNFNTISISNDYYYHIYHCYLQPIQSPRTDIVMSNPL